MLLQCLKLQLKNKVIHSTFEKDATVLQNCLNALTMQFGMTMPCAANPARLSAQKVAFPADVFAVQTHVCIFVYMYLHVYVYVYVFPR